MNVLRTEQLTKRFGGVTATDAVSLSVSEKKIHALIGPNGAGKTTLIAQLSGELAPDSGRVFLNDINITKQNEPARVRSGLCRTFQISSLFPQFSVRENVAFSVQAKAGHSFRFWSDVAKNKSLNARADELLELLGLLDKADGRATALSHGEHRQLEIAMALASKPTVLMLDEPMAGMGSEESARLIELLKKLKSETTLLLVEHDMDAVFALADDLSVLVNGRLIASELENVVAGYGQSQILFDVSLQVEPGQVVSLLGRNGMGKTTTLSTVAGLLGVRSGSVRIAGALVNDKRPYQIAKLGVGVVPEGRQIFPNLSARENLIATAANRFDKRNPWTLDRVLALFPRLEERLDFMGNLLSGGEQQMLAIGRALMTNPKLLILDDATEGLAPQVRASIWQALRTLKDSGLGILLVDKHIADLLPLVDQHHVMDKGRIVWRGTSDEWQSQPDVMAKFFSI
ncbi:UNVERIFIED_CONTAM: hypothetical protein GTU68_017650 [Idotea baltica]|nr:hypothetical protein [Idotea baltica]